VLRKAVQAERQPASGALLQHLEAQLVGLDELGLYIRHPVTFVTIHFLLGENGVSVRMTRSR
jgi:hypothetical protein